MTAASPPGIGAELARAREARGLSLAEVSQLLKFAPRQIEALEQDRFDRLPGSTIARGMVRNYARLLRLDPEPLLERMAGKVAAPDAGRLAARYSEPVPFSDNARRSTLLYIGVSLGVLMVGGGVGYEWYQERSAVRQPAVIAAASQTLDAPTLPAPAPVETPTPVEPAAAPRAEEKKAEEKKAEEKVFPGGRRLVLRAEQEAWIQVKDGADRLLISSLNPAGTERVVYGRPPFSLVIGNAHHVRLLYDDRPIDLNPYVKVEVARFTLK
ncbi:MAG: helix-turn-helix domain-containing protein [Betaproteobacteria bacterium]